MSNKLKCAFGFHNFEYFTQALWLDELSSGGMDVEECTRCRCTIDLAGLPILLTPSPINEYSDYGIAAFVDIEYSTNEETAYYWDEDRAEYIAECTDKWKKKYGELVCPTN